MYKKNLFEKTHVEIYMYIKNWLTSSSVTSFVLLLKYLKIVYTAEKLLTE